MYHVKKDKRSVQSSGWIYGALCALMAERDYEDITVTEVVERAGVGRATFYRNFDTMDDVLRLQRDRVFEELQALMSAQIEKTAGKNLSRELHRLFLAFWYKDSEIIALLMRARRFDMLLRSFETLFTAVAEKAGSLQYIDMRLRPYVLAAACGASIGMLLQWLQCGKDISPDEMADLMDESMQRMMERPPGANGRPCLRFAPMP